VREFFACVSDFHDIRFSEKRREIAVRCVEARGSEHLRTRGRNFSRDRLFHQFCPVFVRVTEREEAPCFQAAWLAAVLG